MNLSNTDYPIRVFEMREIVNLFCTHFHDIAIGVVVDGLSRYSVKNGDVYFDIGPTTFADMKKMLDVCTVNGGSYVTHTHSDSITQSTINTLMGEAISYYMEKLSK